MNDLSSLNINSYPHENFLMAIVQILYKYFFKIIRIRVVFVQILSKFRGNLVFQNNFWMNFNKIKKNEQIFFQNWDKYFWIITHPNFDRIWEQLS